jgi:peptidoglycan/LPS O-acetylase OafA/YrhL
MDKSKNIIETYLREAAKYFVRYFAVLFLILLILVSFGQYNDQGKINWPFSVTFSFPLACLGALFGAILMTVFGRLEATPPWVQASAYLQVDNDLLEKDLSKIRKKRILLFTMFIMWLPYGVFIMATHLPVFFIFAYMASIGIFALVLNFSKCPRCNHYFLYRAKPGTFGDIGNEKLGLLLGVGYINPFSNKCLNCGLSLKK